MSIVDHERSSNINKNLIKTMFERIFERIFLQLFIFILFISGTFIRIQNSMENIVLTVCFRIFLSELMKEK